MTKKRKKMPLIKLVDVWKIYEMGEVKVEALRGINLEVRKGQFVVIMGPSGSGKSTAVNMVGCLDLPTKGTIYLDCRDISHLQESTLANIRGKRIGFIFQTFNLIPTLSAVGNVMLPMTFQGVERKKAEARAKYLLTKVGLSDRMYHKPNEMSGGQQQRVAIARSLSNNPEIIIADEPTGNLDSERGKLIMDFLEEMNKKEGKTIILVTHDRNLTKYADRAEYILDGKIIKSEDVNKERKK